MNTPSLPRIPPPFLEHAILLRTIHANCDLAARLGGVRHPAAHGVSVVCAP
jgi:hypothetical protein